jgi:hypothetical protein
MLKYDGLQLDSAAKPAADYKNIMAVCLHRSHQPEGSCDLMQRSTWSYAGTYNVCYMKLSVHYLERFIRFVFDVLTTDNSTGIRQKWKQSVPRYSTNLRRIIWVRLPGFDVNSTSNSRQPLTRGVEFTLTAALLVGSWKNPNTLITLVSPVMTLVFLVDFHSPVWRRQTKLNYCWYDNSSVKAYVPRKKAQAHDSCKYLNDFNFSKSQLKHFWWIPQVCLKCDRKINLNYGNSSKSNYSNNTMRKLSIVVIMISYPCQLPF